VHYEFVALLRRGWNEVGECVLDSCWVEEVGRVFLLLSTTGALSLRHLEWRVYVVDNELRRVA
jgi:hypothetical protein